MTTSATPATVRNSWIHLSSDPPLAELCPKPPRAAFVVQEAPMSDSAWGGKGRPKKGEAERRKGKFLCLIADGMDAVAARKEAGIDPDRALRIVTESDYLDVVRAIRAEGGIVAAIVAAPEQQAA